uniref:Uncharacterized protein n=1 Tax=Chrysotila carterae TaxID=13221 RepID=A0A7S4B0N7_CHRCT
MTPLFTLAALVGGSAAMALNVPAVSNARPAARAVVEAHGCHSRRSVFLLGVSALSLLVEMPVAAFAADADLASCRKDCFKECNALAPGNQAYCAQQCDDYCADAEVTGAADVLRSDPSSPSTENNLGIFGDSGVSYSKGVEDLFATAFGATRQGTNVNKADVGNFASDVVAAAKAAAAGSKK